MREFTLTGSEGALTLRGNKPDSSRPYDPWEYEAEIKAHALTARVGVYDHMPDRFPEFFKNLASDWQGWSEHREYESLEPMLKISASHDGIGCITFAIRLRAGTGTGFDWSASQNLTVEPGNLRQIAAAAREFVV